MTTFDIDWYVDGNTDESRMVLTHCGIVTLVSPLQSEKAEDAIPRTSVKSKSPESVPVLPIAQPSINLTFGIVTISKSESLQPENTEFPIYVTLSGIIKLIKLLQPLNALSPILVTPLPIITFVSPLHP